MSLSCISDLHSKFALGPHHVSKYGRHPFCDRSPLRLGEEKKQEEETVSKKKKLHIMSASATQGGPAAITSNEVQCMKIGANNTLFTSTW